jgi:hypothetical protein
VVTVAPQVPVVAMGLPPVPVITTRVPLAVIAAAVPQAVTISEVHIGVVRIDSIVVGGGSPCPHLTALLDRSDQPIRARDTGLVILVETH